MTKSLSRVSRPTDRHLAMIARVLQASVPFLSAPLIVGDIGISGLGQWVVVQAVVQVPFIVDLGLADLSFQTGLKQLHSRANRYLAALLAWETVAGAGTVLIFVLVDAVTLDVRLLVGYVILTSLLYPALLSAVANDRAKRYYVPLGAGQLAGLIALAAYHVSGGRLTLSVLTAISAAALVPAVAGALRLFANTDLTESSDTSSYAADARFAAAQQLNNLTNYALFAVDKIVFASIGGFSSAAIWDTGGKLPAFGRTLVTAQIPLWQRRISIAPLLHDRGLSREYTRSWLVLSMVAAALSVPYSVLWVGISWSSQLAVSVVGASAISAAVLSTGLLGARLRQASLIKPELIANAIMILGKCLLALAAVHAVLGFDSYVVWTCAVVAISSATFAIRARANMCRDTA